MKTSLFWVCALFGAPAVALAQSAPQADPTDAGAAVPHVVYQSVFEGAPKGVETTSVDWKKANADVGQFTRGHVDILKWEASQASPNPPAGAQKSAPPNKPAAHQH